MSKYRAQRWVILCELCGEKSRVEFFPGTVDLFALHGHGLKLGDFENVKSPMVMGQRHWYLPDGRHWATATEERWHMERTDEQDVAGMLESLLQESQTPLESFWPDVLVISGQMRVLAEKHISDKCA